MARTASPDGPATEAVRHRTTDHRRGASTARDPVRSPTAAVPAAAFTETISIRAGPVRYNKRLRAASSLLRQAVRVVAADTDLWFDDVWVTDPARPHRPRRPPRRSAGPRGGYAV